MKIDFLYDIISIYNQKSIKRAAEERGISEVTFRKRIEALQEEVGDKIYNINGSKIELTDEGISFYFYAINALSQLTGYKNKHLENHYDNEISIGVDINIFLGYIYICSKLVGEKYNVVFKILQLYKENILDAVRDEKYDAGIIIMDRIVKEKVERYNLTYNKICTRRPVIMVSEKHPLARFNEISLMDLQDYKRIALKNSFEEFYCFEHDIEIKYNLKRSNIVFKYLNDILLSLRNSQFYFIGGINEDEEVLLKGIKVIEIKELKERIEVGYIYNKKNVLKAPIKAIVNIRETFKTIKK